MPLILYNRTQAHLPHGEILYSPTFKVPEETEILIEIVKEKLSIWKRIIRFIKKLFRKI